MAVSFPANVRWSNSSGVFWVENSDSFIAFVPGYCHKRGHGSVMVMVVPVRSGQSQMCQR